MHAATARKTVEAVVMKAAMAALHAIRNDEASLAGGGGQ
jgi:hypothetical protein